MATNRPAIPRAVQEQVLLEVRHRCAVCCEPVALEKAHIVPWGKTQDHAPENLVVLVLQVISECVPVDLCQQFARFVESEIPQQQHRIVDDLLCEIARFALTPGVLEPFIGIAIICKRVARREEAARAFSS